jgi:hypothetical protein
MRLYQSLKLTTILALSAGISFAQDAPKTTSGNPIAQGWYADPEAKIFGKEYWVYPGPSTNIL